MLYFAFTNFREFQARKSEASFNQSLSDTIRKHKAMRKYQRKAESRERRELTTQATKILFSQPQQAVASIRKALEAGEYKHLNLIAKEVTMAYVIVHNEQVCTLKKCVLDATKLEYKPVASMRDLIKSLEQKRKLVDMAQKQIDKGLLPRLQTARKYVASILK